MRLCRLKSRRSSGFSLARRVAWRRQRLYVRCRVPITALLLVIGISGVVFGADVRRWFVLGAPFGRPAAAGYVVVRPPTAAGAVPPATVTLAPLGPAPGPLGRVAAVLSGSGPPPTLLLPPDVSGYWAAGAGSLRLNWRYRLVAAVDGCPGTAVVEVTTRVYRVLTVADLVVTDC